MIVPRNTDLAGDVLIARRQFQAGASSVLADGGAVKLLPRRLMVREWETAFGLQLGAAARHFLGRNQDIGLALVQIDAHLVAGLEDRKPAVGGCFRRSVEDRRRS